MNDSHKQEKIPDTKEYILYYSIFTQLKKKKQQQENLTHVFRSQDSGYL